MLGAIIGDLAGSIYEFDQVKKHKNIEIKNIIQLLVECKLSSGGCTFTYDVGTKQRKATKKKASVLGNMIQAPKRSSVDSNRTL